MTALVVLAATTLIVAATIAPAASGAAWSLQGTAEAGAPETLDSVSCSSERACLAVGSYTNEAREALGLTETWNGSAWSRQVAVLPEGSTGSEFADVSCTSETACTAVGRSRKREIIRTSNAPLVERWNGSEWNTQSLAAPPRGSAVLYGVSCASSTSCIAVGTASESGGSEVLAESWNGTEWSVQPTPRTQGALYDISCTSSSACTAVGYASGAGGTLVTLALRWNGREWITQTTPNGSAEFSFLLDVSCTNATSCVAVGNYDGRSVTGVLFTAIWNGTTWVQKEAPKPTGTEYSALFSVSCTSERACVSVGTYRTRPEVAQATLAEQWDGERWTLQTTPNPRGSRQTVFHSVSCTSSVLCTATGFSDVTGMEALAERYS